MVVGIGGFQTKPTHCVVIESRGGELSTVTPLFCIKAFTALP
jgi:hypothetical protein